MLPLEIVAASITIDFWHSTVNKAVWVTIFWILIVIINLFGVKGYGEAEFVFSLIKVVAVIGFMYVFFAHSCFQTKHVSNFIPTAFLVSSSMSAVDQTASTSAAVTGQTLAHSTTASRVSAASS